jgi:crotonobetainyl-CoA:carnitine CoA-transferase CaiB-like acyl-CoA transferase
MGPLAGLKVIDLTHVMAGPTCTLMLADMGADVIKIEKTPQGDDTRATVPPKVGDEAAAFLMMNRNKRGVVIDLKTAGGARVLRRLLRSADILVENFAPGVMARLGFAYEDLRADNPGLIYCSLSGFGRTGPYKHRRGFDLVAQAMSGIMSFTGERPDGPPVKCGAPLSDITAGILAAMGILAAYIHRLKTGEGQCVDTSLFEAALVQTYWQSAIALATGVAPRAMGSAHPLNAPYQAFEASDGWIVVGGANQKNWLRTLEALDALELASDPRFVSGADRMAHLHELEAELAPRFRVKPAAHWLYVLEQRGVPCGPGVCRSSSRKHRDACAPARRFTASTRARCWPSMASAKTRSPRSNAKARLLPPPGRGAASVKKQRLCLTLSEWDRVRPRLECTLELRHEN